MCSVFKLLLFGIKGVNISIRLHSLHLSLGQHLTKLSYPYYGLKIRRILNFFVY